MDSATPWDLADPNPPPIPKDQELSSNVATLQANLLENSTSTQPPDTPASETQSQEEQASEELFTQLHLPLLLPSKLQRTLANVPPPHQ